MARYPRYSDVSYSFGPGALSPAIKILIIVNVVVFLVSLVVPTLVLQLGLSPRSVFGQLTVYQLVTYMFLHGDVGHILFNMLALWMFGSELESLWGTRRFVRFYFITGVGAAICSTLVAPNSTIPIIGASGAVYGILAAYGILFPDRILLLYFVIPIKAKYFVLILGALAFWSSLSATGGGVAHIAHLGGMLFGWLYLRAQGSTGFRGFRGFRLRNPLRGWRERRRREQLKKKFKVYYRNTRGEDEDE
jgi:membrane associated rhomboid family serine protease